MVFRRTTPIWVGRFCFVLGVFLSIAGNSASIVRAAWVVGLSLAAGYFGRSIRPIVLLSLPAAATAWFDPYYVWFDLGWWLSFTAFFGVLMLAPVLNTRLFGTNKPGFWPELAVESLSATLLTAPLILWIFQRVSIVSLLSNMVVVPIVSLIMLLSFIAGGLCISMGLGYVTKVVTLLSGKLLDGVVLVSETLAKAPLVEVSFGISARADVGDVWCDHICNVHLERKNQRQEDLLPTGLKLKAL